MKQQRLEVGTDVVAPEEIARLVAVVLNDELVHRMADLGGHPQRERDVFHTWLFRAVFKITSGMRDRSRDANAERTVTEMAQTVHRTDDVHPLIEPIADHVLSTERHENAPAAVIRADEVQTVLSTLRTEAGLDHCACVTAQEYADRFETIYHLRRYADPTQELSVVVPTARESPTSESAVPVYPTAAWHEREAYDLVGIEYEDHPDLRRILLPETWQGHPLSRDYNQDQPQIVSFREHERLLEDRREGPETMHLNMGPHHPSTHGVLHLNVQLDGEQVAAVDPDIGYIHRCEEQMCQQGATATRSCPTRTVGTGAGPGC